MTTPDVQYDSMARQHAAGRLGMWAFLGSELLLFAGLLALYGAYRFAYPAEFRIAAQDANVAIGSINTLVLLTSSLTMALALHAARAPGDPRARLLVLLAITFALGVTFDVLKGVEYAGHLADGTAPGGYSAARVAPPHGIVLYVTLYYVLTGLHALHVTIGIGVIAWLWSKAWRRQLTPDSHAALELGGLYWHLVDLVWLFLWPLLYLIR